MLNKAKSEATKALWRNPEYRKLMAKRRGTTGIHFSKEARKNMSEAHKGINAGEKHPMFGIKHTNETKGKIAERRVGACHSEETKNKISNSLKGLNAGPKHYKWNGSSSVVKQIRTCFEYRKWRESIFKRDNYTCANCMARGVYLEAHHCNESFVNIFNRNKIKTLQDAINCSEFWNTDNGITLCGKCHRKNKKLFTNELKKHA